MTLGAKTRIFPPDPVSRLLCLAHCRPRASGALGVADANPVSHRQGAVGVSARPLIPRGNVPRFMGLKAPLWGRRPCNKPTLAMAHSFLGSRGAESTNPPTTHPSSRKPASSQRCWCPKKNNSSSRGSDPDRQNGTVSLHHCKENPGVKTKPTSALPTPTPNFVISKGQTCSQTLAPAASDAAARLVSTRH